MSDRREYRIAVWHGEHCSLFYVISVNPDNGEEWEVEASFRRRDWAQSFIEALTEKDWS